MRNHEPIVIEDFNGLWARGTEDSCPRDHSFSCNNVKFIHSGIETRDGLDTYRAIGNPVRIFKYTLQEDNGQSMLILNDSGEIYHSPDETTTYGPILTIPEMTDFNMIAVAGRAYITPFTTYFDAVTNQALEKGLDGEFVYVYQGDGTNARKIAGFPPTNGDLKPFIVYNATQIDGHVSQGVHIIAVECDGVAVAQGIYAPGAKQLFLHNIPLSTIGGLSRTIYATKAIDIGSYVLDYTTYTYYSIVTIPDNVTEDYTLNFDDANYSVPAILPPLTLDNGELRAVTSSTVGYSDLGLHLIGVLYETDTGYLTKPGPEQFAALFTIDTKRAIDVSNIPVSPDSFVTKRHLVATQSIRDYNGDQTGFQFFFIPDGNIDDNTTTTKTVSFYDSDLLDDASHLLENFSEVEAGCGLSSYHGRMIVHTQYDDISVLRVSHPGEPESISEVDGLVIIPLDGNPVTICQEFRDVLYAFKTTRTAAVSDNGDVPSSWPVIFLEQGLGSPVHGIATVLDSGGINIDFLIVVTLPGIYLFDGIYKEPPITYKIEDFWEVLDKNDYRFIQIMNDTINSLIWVSLPDRDLLMGDYSEGLSPENIRWCPATFDIEVTTIALIERDRLIIGALQEA